MVAAVGVAMLLLAGCGGGKEETTQRSLSLEAAEQQVEPRASLKPLAFALDGFPSPENVGVLLADRLGYFADAGFDAFVSPPLTPVNVIPYVADQSADLAISHQPEVIKARDQGLPVVAVGSVVPDPTLALIWLPGKGIESIADLRGKTIAITGMSFEKDLVEAILAKADLTPAEVDVNRVVNNLVPALVDGRADAILGTWNVEGFDLTKRGLNPVITRVGDLGVPTFEELVVVTHRSTLSQEPELVREFMTALRRGMKAAAENPQMAAEAIAATPIQPTPGNYMPKPTVAEVEKTLPLLSRSGEMSVAEAGSLSDWMHQQGFVKRDWPPSAFMTNGLLRRGS